MSVLVIDDEAEVRHVVSRILARLGAGRVDTAGSAADALRVVNPSINLIVCDVQMPGGGAEELLRGLATCDVRPQVVLMSGAGDAALAEAAAVGQAVGLPVVARLVKPLTVPALEAALQSVIAGTPVSAPPDEANARPAESAMAMKEVLHFAHEAAGPLMTVTMLSELLLDAGGLTPSQMDDVRQIQRAANMLSKMLKDLK